MLIIFIGLFIIFLILNVLDAYSTYQVISYGSYRSERNPLARWIIKKNGNLKGILLVKSAIIIIIPMIIYAYHISHKEIIYVLIGINIVYTLVVINNFKIVKRIKLT